MLGLQRIGDGGAGHGAEQLALGAALSGDFYLAALELFGNGLGGCLGLGVSLGLGLIPQLHGVHRVGGGGHGNAVGDQIVAGLTLGSLDHLALFALAPHILRQNHFHVYVLLYVRLVCLWLWNGDKQFVGAMSTSPRRLMGTLS